MRLALLLSALALGGGRRRLGWCDRGASGRMACATAAAADRTHRRPGDADRRLLRPDRDRRSRCQFGVYAFPRGAVEVVVVEWTSLYRTATWHRRPSRFTPRTLPLRPAPAVECSDGPAAAREFVDHGRHLGVYVLLGSNAPRALAARARDVLDSLRSR